MIHLFLIIMTIFQAAGQLELVKNLTIDRINNVYDNMIATYRSLPNYQNAENNA